MHCKFFQRLALFPLLLLPVFPIPVQAEQAAIQKVSSNQAQGTTQTGVQKVVLGMHSVNISFIPTGEVIQKVWLDNPSQIVIDFDGCLPSAANQNQGSSCSENSGATIIRLRQLPKPINFPAGYFSNTRTVNLTVVATDGSARKLYQFQLVLGGGNPPYSTIEVIPAPAPAPAQLESISAEYQRTILTQLSRGLAHAEANGMIDRSSGAYSQMQQTIALMQSGTNFEQAVAQSGVPRKLVDRLRMYGSKSSVNSAAPTRPTQVSPNQPPVSVPLNQSSQADPNFIPPPR